jgi:protoporphyrinogen oxidase
MALSNTNNEPVAIIGAGLTGLSAAFILNRNNIPVQVFEAESFVGGAARTIKYGDYSFDLGTHRFYTKNQEVLNLVNELLNEEMLAVNRLTRIYLKGKLVEYPLNFFNALSALDTITILNAVTSYSIERGKNILRSSPEDNFEDWLIRRFGRSLYELYFRSYSEKVWGIPCSQLRADFAAQRIKDLSLWEAFKNMLDKKKNKAMTLERQFLYPTHGFGRISESLAKEVPPSSIRLNSPIKCLEHDGQRIIGIMYKNNGKLCRYEPAHVISTFSISEMVHCLYPTPPVEVLNAAAGLKYRDQIFVFLALDCEQVTPDHWIYFSSDDVFFGRVHEPKNWSSVMSPAGKTSLVAEIFCFENEPIWTESDESLMNRVSHRIAELGLIEERQVIDGCVIRLKKAYPLYMGDYEKRIKVILDFIRPIKNLQIVGRNGLFKYTSGDYCIEMGIKAAENLMGYNHDLLSVASEKKYAES